jgi:hypothetical protein
MVNPGQRLFHLLIELLARTAETMVQGVDGVQLPVTRIRPEQLARLVGRQVAIAR